MPILIQNSCSDMTVPTVSDADVVSKLVQIILRSRMRTAYRCLQEHRDTPCCLELTGDAALLAPWRGSGFTMVVNVMQCATRMTLLERWVVTFDPTNALPTMADDAILLLQTVYSYTRLLPAHVLIAHKSLQKSDLHFSVTLTDNARQTFHCYSTASPPGPSVEFSSHARLTSHRFRTACVDTLGLVTVEVVFDEPPAPREPQIEAVQKQLEEKLHLKESGVSRPRDIPQPQQGLLSSHWTHNTPSPTSVVSMRRLSRLSLSAMQQDEEGEDETEEDLTPTFAVPIPSPRMQYTHPGHHGLRTVAYSTSPSTTSTWPKAVVSSVGGLALPIVPSQRRGSYSLHGEHHGRLVGSYEESLLSGRMSAMPSKPITFHAQIGVLGQGDCKSSLRCPPHLSVIFPASFYDLQDDELPTPYVGTVDLIKDEHGPTPSIPGYRIPPKGQLQIVLKNPNKTAVKLFLIPYDVTDMPRCTKTFLRQKSYTETSAHAKKAALRYAIHVQICRTDRKRVYLYKHLRVVFVNRIADSNEKLIVECEGPKEPKYLPLTRADLDIIHPTRRPKDYEG